MAKSEMQELTELEDSELETRLAEAKDALFKNRFKHVTGQLENTATLRQYRQRVARINTLLRAREIAAAEALEEKR